MERGVAMGTSRDQFEVTLEDGDLLDEVELTTSLIVRVADYDRHLSAEEIDRVLGVDRGE